MKSWWLSSLKSIANAVSGFRYNLLYEKNFSIQLFIAVLVVIAALALPVKRTEWLILIIVIGAVLSAEAMNTAVEKVCDLFGIENDKRLKTIKDSSASAVLIISIAAAVIGFIIFIPYLIDMFCQSRFAK